MLVGRENPVSGESEVGRVCDGCNKRSDFAAFPPDYLDDPENMTKRFPVIEGWTDPVEPLRNESGFRHMDYCPKCSKKKSKGGPQ